MTPEQAAEAVIRLANVLMAGAIRMVSLSRGHDPRDFTLFAFGGAGPLHAVALAREIGIPEVFVPFRPGLTNALGCLVADLRQDIVNTLNRGLDDIAEAEIADVLAGAGIARARRCRARRRRGRAHRGAARRRDAVPRPDASDPRAADLGHAGAGPRCRRPSKRPTSPASR